MLHKHINNEQREAGIWLDKYKKYFISNSNDRIAVHKLVLGYNN